MKFKKLFLITLLLLAILTMTAVSASDNLTDEGILQDTPYDEIELSHDSSEEVIANPASNECLSGTISVEGNGFSDIRTTVNSANIGDTIRLNGTYINDIGESINLNKDNLTIDGGGNTVLDGNSSRIFKVSEKNIVIKNIKFVNCHMSYGGAIGVFSDNCAIDNCQFINCTSTYQGGAVYFESRGDHMNITNCIFKECSSEFGAAFAVGEVSDGNVYDCIFEKCYASLGGVLSANQDYCLIRLYDCIFKDNLSPMYTSSDNVEVYSKANSSSSSQSSSGSSSGASKTTKPTPKLTAKKATFKVKTKIKKYAAILKTDKNKAMKKVNLYLKVKGKTYTAKTNSQGKAIFKIKNLKKKGTYKATVTFKGNSNYNKVTKTVKIKIK